MTDDEDEVDGNDGEPPKIDDETRERMEEKLDEVLEEHEIPREFPEAALHEVDEITDGYHESIAEEAEKDERRDLRDLLTFTCDPKRAQDFDDAISIERSDDNDEGVEWTLWVHIADVSHYVTPDTQLYEAAKRRANSVYLPGHTVHMLPPQLAETVCSLVPYEDRLAHTVRMELNDELSFEEIDIFKSVIRSDRRLTYTQAESILDEGPGAVEDVTPELASRIVEAYEVADALHETRKEDGSLVLNPKRDRAHTIVEECMLKANRAVTHRLMFDRGVQAMYRVHPQPTEEQWGEALQEIQELDGVSIPADKWDQPRFAVNEAIESANETELRKIQRAVLRVMPRAKYMTDPFGGHYALNFDIYGHFTSPIRRIADLVNHRIVHENDVPDDLTSLADRATRKQQDAEAAEREFKKYLEELGFDPHEVEEYKLGED
ncbi:MAG: ribonuclease R family protein [Halobacteria archaeon]|nr:ribonuclease R family protein [Halobacteria archaeon]